MDGRSRKGSFAREPDHHPHFTDVVAGGQEGAWLEGAPLETKPYAFQDWDGPMGV